jgi:DNA-binding transcriptional LysR family regulator
MELRHLRYFCAVAEHQGFSKTARLLHISQSAISEQISDLEKEVGGPLLIRGRQKLLLTPHGEVFLEEAKKVLAASDRAIEMAQRSLKGEVGTLNVGFFNGGTGTLVPAIMRDFRKRHPGVRVSVYELLPSQQSEALLNGVIDVGFTRPLDPPFDKLLKTELLYPDPLVAVLPKDHHLASAPVDVRRLAGEKFVLVARDSSTALFDKIIAVCNEAGFSPEITATGSVWSTVVLLVEAGTGVAILPSNLQQSGAREVAFQPLTNRGASIDLVIAWSPQRSGPVQEAFLALAHAHCKSGASVHRE